MAGVRSRDRGAGYGGLIHGSSAVFPGDVNHHHIPSGSHGGVPQPAFTRWVGSAAAPGRPGDGSQAAEKGSGRVGWVAGGSPVVMPPATAWPVLPRITGRPEEGHDEGRWSPDGDLGEETVTAEQTEVIMLFSLPSGLARGATRARVVDAPVDGQVDAEQGDVRMNWCGSAFDGSAAWVVAEALPAGRVPGQDWFPRRGTQSSGAVVWPGGGACPVCWRWRRWGVLRLRSAAGVRRARPQLLGERCGRAQVGGLAPGYLQLALGPVEARRV